MCRTTMYPWKKLTSYSSEELPQTQVFKRILENKHISVFTVPQRDGVLSEVSSPASAPDTTENEGVGKGASEPRRSGVRSLPLLWVQGGFPHRFQLPSISLQTSSGKHEICKRT